MNWSLLKWLNKFLSCEKIKCKNKKLKYFFIFELDLKKISI